MPSLKQDPIGCQTTATSLSVLQLRLMKADSSGCGFFFRIVHEPGEDIGVFKKALGAGGGWAVYACIILMPCMHIHQKDAQYVHRKSSLRRYRAVHCDSAYVCLFIYPHHYVQKKFKFFKFLYPLISRRWHYARSNNCLVRQRPAYKPFVSSNWYWRVCGSLELPRSNAVILCISIGNRLYY